MEPTSIYIFFTIILIALAVTDLIVGVSNDAVNFLNSSIGSRVAPRKVILLVASLGIAIGATFSSGMMEVARKGIFNPQMFVFADLMVLFLAVMLTDIILLDLFNTFGLPTSTTVSIVFELLGAAVAVSLLKIAAAGDSFSTLPEYINSEKAILIVSGIFLSIVIAFGIGMFAQYLSRLVFTFDYKSKLKRYGAIFGGLSITMITYFILIKGAKGSSLMTAATTAWITGHTLQIVIGSIIGWTLLIQLLMMTIRLNVLKLIVLVGTFSLAMAFAGNDLVNFIGVPIAALESFLSWNGSGIDPEAFGMDFLAAPIRTPTLYLLAAGIIMVVTLWFSKKAKSVTETEVRLARQGFGTERFRPNFIARLLVGAAVKFGTGIQLLPAKVSRATSQRFEKTEDETSEEDQPAFDLVRASVNLSMASILIAFATSLHMPLSTTYVSFMVAMGTSLADRAWDRDTAVFRVSGVLTVIGGWFITAAAAFTGAALFALIIWNGGFWAVIILLAFAIGLVFRTHVLHKKRMESEERVLPAMTNNVELAESEVEEEARQLVSSTLKTVGQNYASALVGLIEQDAVRLKLIDAQIDKLKNRIGWIRNSVFFYIRKLKKGDTHAGSHFLKLLEISTKLIETDRRISKSCRDYVQNKHKPLKDKQVADLEVVKSGIQELLGNVSVALSTMDDPETTHYLRQSYTELQKKLNLILDKQVARIQKRKGSPRNSMFYLSIILESRELTEQSRRLYELMIAPKVLSAAELMVEEEV